MLFSSKNLLNLKSIHLDLSLKFKSRIQYNVNQG